MRSLRSSGFRSNCYACWSSAAGKSSRARKFWSALWGKGVFVDIESGINTAVRKLRRALSDDPDAPRFVVTVPARGYRFVAEVRQAEISRTRSAFRPRSPAVMVGRERELASAAGRTRGRAVRGAGAYS